MNSKKRCQIRHSQRRALERYGLSLSRQDVNLLANLIKKGGKNVKFLERLSGRLTVWELPFRDEVIVVLYDKYRNSIATILPKDCDERRTITEVG